MAVLAKYLELWNLLSEVVLQTEIEDNLHIWQLSPSESNYLAKSAYEVLFIGAVQFRPWEMIWKARPWANVNSSCGWLHVIGA